MTFQKGHKHSPETIAKIKAARARQIITDEHKKAIGEGVKRAGNIPPSFLGKKHSEETKQKISESRKGSKHYNWKGGRIKKKNYWLVHTPDHPNCGKKGYVREHRLVMEKHLGRYLTLEEVVHHINNNESDNRLENLMLFPNNVAHLAYHKELRNLQP